VILLKKDWEQAGSLFEERVSSRFLGRSHEELIVIRKIVTRKKDSRYVDA
jgi:hypothetical protein